DRISRRRAHHRPARPPHPSGPPEDRAPADPPPRTRRLGDRRHDRQPAAQRQHLRAQRDRLRRRRRDLRRAPRRRGGRRHRLRPQARAPRPL
ncbi:MAG: hypothetical protein AVDCRST_MAG30-3926, partial [uncultured Solirubrobacteraceae bacterium]